MTGEFAEGRPLCAKGFHFLDTEGATYTLKDGRVRCTACKKARAKRSRQRAKEKREAAERRARLRDEKKAAKPPKQAAVPGTVVLPPGGVGSVRGRNGFSGAEQAARYRLAQAVRASRRAAP